VGDFSLTERSGRTVTRADLLGKVWVASFVFTRCTQGCPQVSATMKDLQASFAAYPNVLLVTFTVDPDHDDPAELRRYAEHFGADPNRWLFLTGMREAQLHKLIKDSFHLYAEPTRGQERRPGNEFAHDTKLVVVDADGHIRGYFDGMRSTRNPDPEQDYQDNLRRLRQLVDFLAVPPLCGVSVPSVPAPDFPLFNAMLNACSAVLLLLGYGFIRSRNVRLHVTCMLTALAVSALFLTSYLYYHLVVKGGRPTYFHEQAVGAPAWVGHVYLAVLASHTLLAAVTPPLALYVAYQGLRGRLARHVRVARWTLPLWLYVSVTGVVVYWMLYRLYPGP
jgi:protein SCO1/2/putative membrane protein